MVLEQGADAGVLQEPGRPHVSIRRSNRVRGSGHNPRPPEARSPTAGANIERTDGTGHTRDDRSAPGRAWGVVAPRYDRRSGGTDPRDPAEERGEPGHGLSRESGRRDQELTNSLPEWLDSEERWVRIRGDIWASNLQRTHGSKNRMRKTCTSGSVGARGGNRPGLPGDTSTLALRAPSEVDSGVTVSPTCCPLRGPRRSARCFETGGRGDRQVKERGVGRPEGLHGATSRNSSI